MPKHKLLAVTPQPVWPVRDGLALRIHHMLEALSREWSVMLVTGRDLAAGNCEDSVGHNHETGVATAQHITVPLDGRWRTDPTQYSTAPLLRAVGSLVQKEKPDVALLWPGAEFLAWSIPGFPVSIADRIDCLTLASWRAQRSAETIVKRMQTLRDLMPVAKYERRIARRLSATTVVSDVDASALSRISGSNKIRVVPNGVAIQNQSLRRATVPTAVFSGTLYYAPNVSAALHLAKRIWPMVRAAIPGAELIIAGRGPTPEVAALGRLPGVTIKADVERMEPVLGSAWVAAAPMMEGAGIKNKILEAWACGTSVIMSKMAMNGLSIPPGHESLIVDDTAEFARRLCELLQSQHLCGALGEEAQYFVRANYTWESAARQLSGLLRGDLG